MSSSSNSHFNSQIPRFQWLNPLRPTTFRVIVGLGFGAIVLLLINLFTPGTLGASAYVWSVVTAVASYLLAEVLLLLFVALGPLVGFTYGVIAYFSH